MDVIAIDHVLYEMPVKLAIDGSLAIYGDVAPLIELDMALDADHEETARRLEDIVIYVHAQGRSMLTVLVVHKGGGNNPGEGLFSAAEKIRFLIGSRRDVERIIYWVNQVTLVHNQWSI
ncbi:MULTISPECIES: hypothetical protein [unclassified Stenotrophomonas maltophilia group]|uniref:hypothetical protein n=1 Tax=unclassified Stenotrophomonas maltophilia group TaxID=2961925 RepID=UPI00131EFEC4|nr:MULTISPECIES: hypothetical protein [unclassified Stenotrophomonas maltophilia group]